MIYRCLKCGTENEISCEQIEWEEINEGEREMGRETMHTGSLTGQCEKCKQHVDVTFSVWEYPVGTKNAEDSEYDHNSIELLEGCEKDIKIL